MCEPPNSNLYRVEKISYKHKPTPNVKKSIDITCIENSIVIFEYIKEKQTYKETFIITYDIIFHKSVKAISTLPYCFKIHIVNIFYIIFYVSF